MVRPLRAGRHLPEEGATPERDIGARSATAMPDRRSAPSLAQHFTAPPFRREIDKAGGSQSRHWHMSGKIGHSCRCPSWQVGQTRTFAARLVITPIFATRSTGDLPEGSLKRSDITC